MTAIQHKLIEFRKTLHANPELSGEEKQTAARIAEFLESCNPDVLHKNIGGHGLIATWDSGNKGKTILLRADMDALPIEEINEFEHKSINLGVSHKCGHDGHSTILCAVAHDLSENRPLSGKVHLLFQPSEENGEGAKAVIETAEFKNIAPDFVFALHNLPGYPTGHIVVKEGIFTAAVNSIIINLKGKTSHAAEPEHGINPAMAVSNILREAVLMEYNHPEKKDMRVITPVYVELGSKSYGISAGQASVHLTLRCWDNENLKKLEKEIEQLATQYAERHRLLVNFEYTQTFHANMNHKEAVEVVRKASKLTNHPLIEKQDPFKWGEDFGLFTTKYKGCMFGLGSGENCPALHNPDYDFPDELINIGKDIFIGILNLFTSNKDNLN
jgi:amidohydrolase